MGRHRVTEKLVVMSWGGGWGRALRTCVSEPFTRATGIHVEHVEHVGLALPHALDQIERRPPYDVVWSNAFPALRIAARGGARPLDAVANRAGLAPRAQLHPALAIPYVVHYVLVHRTAVRPPSSYAELLDVIWHERIAMYPGGNGFHAIAQLAGGGTLSDIPDAMAACWRFVEALAPQLASLEYSIAMGPRFARGELDLAFRALPNALAFRDEGVDVDWVVPWPGVTDTLDALWIPRRVPDDVAALAERYIDYALAPSTQEAWSAKLGVLPTHREARIPALFGTRGLPASLDDPAVLWIDDTVKAAHELGWEARFASIARSAASTPWPMKKGS